jgi:hypothetical protein
VQGLLEEEAAARGRLERTRLGALALPRGDRPGRAPPAASARASRSKVSAPGSGGAARWAGAGEVGGRGAASPTRNWAAGGRGFARAPCGLRAW